MSLAETGTGQVSPNDAHPNRCRSTLLYQAHRCSDWVVPVDRTLGVEYFDNPGSPRRPDYIIDSPPQARWEPVIKW